MSISSKSVKWRRGTVCLSKPEVQASSAIPPKPAGHSDGMATLFLIDDTEAILLALAQAVEQRDRSTAGHCERMAFYGVSIGIAMDLDRVDLLTLYRGGYL